MMAREKGSPPNGEAGISGKLIRPQIKATASGFSGNAAAEVKPDLLAAHFCCCKPGVPCVFCLRWDRKIRTGNARRADPVWRQAIGERARGVA